jgi:uncharacterized Zn-finger protein
VQTTNPEHTQQQQLQNTEPQSTEPQSTSPKSAKLTRIKLVRKKEHTKKRTITSITAAIMAIKYRKFTKPKYEKGDTAIKRRKSTKPKSEKEGALFTCGICGIKIKRKTNLQQHELTHNPNSEKKHSCNYCSYKCHRKHDVVRHEARRHGVGQVVARKWGKKGRPKKPSND